jgi:hypothetical protein
VRGLADISDGASVVISASVLTAVTAEEGASELLSLPAQAVEASRRESASVNETIFFIVMIPFKVI